MSFVSGSRLTPASVGSLNTLLGSSKSHTQEPHRLLFTQDGWDDRNCLTRQWYESQKCTRFTHLQYRKEEDTLLKHEFIVAELANGTVCRFDRRGETDTRGEVFVEGLRSEDTVHVLERTDPRYVELEMTSRVQVRVGFPHGQDILSILATCYGVQMDDRAKFYTLLRFNCYFLSWTILTAATRRTVDWTALGRDARLWEGLVKAGIGKTAPGREGNKAGNRFSISRMRGAGQTTHTMPFIGEAYLVETLRKALLEARETITKTLRELILYSSVEQAIRELASECARKAATGAAKTHAYRAARDAAMEAVVETMWKQVLNGPGNSMGEAWETESKAVAEAVCTSCEAAAKMDLGERLEGDKWEAAWRVTWKDEDAGGLVSLRAKAAWREAWVKACEVNEDYIPKISAGVAEYVMSHLPRSTPMDLKIEIKPLSLPVTLGFDRSELTDADLQKYIEKRIANHSRNAANSQIGNEIVETMRHVWAEAVSLDLNWATKTSQTVPSLA